MITSMPIAQIQYGTGVDGYYLMKEASLRQTKRGTTFLLAVLQDISGQIGAVKWEYNGEVAVSDAGKVVHILGRCTSYADKLQVVLDSIRLAEPSEGYDPSGLVPTAPISIPDELREVEKFVATIEDTDYAAICREMLNRHKEHFWMIPAAKSVHHGFAGGLLMHTCNMLRLADYVAGQYRDTVNRDLLMAGVLLHDMAKDREFATSEFGLVTEYSVPGVLLGHLVMGAEEVAEIAKELGAPREKSVLLQHLLLSHHGQPEFGAAVYPVCAESELLSLIDLIDSRMEIYREAMDRTPVGEFSDRIYGLDNRRILHHE